MVVVVVLMREDQVRVVLDLVLVEVLALVTRRMALEMVLLLLVLVLAQVPNRRQVVLVSFLVDLRL